MAHKTLYVSPKDAPLWEAVERVAAQRQTSVTRIVVEALERDLSRAAKVPADRFAHIAADAA